MFLKGLIGALIASVLGGVVGFIAFVILFFLYWYWMLRRNLILTRSYLYLLVLEKGRGESVANQEANSLTLQDATYYLLDAFEYHQAQADYYQEQADAGFALYEEMEDFKDDLLADYNDDGVLSDEARQRALDLIRRAGKDTDNLTDDMIVQLYLQAQQETLNTSVFNQARADENRDKADEYEQERLAIQSMAYDGALQAEATGNRDEYVAQATGMILQVESLYAEQVTLESEADFLENGLFTEAHIISDESPAEQPVTQSTLEVGLF